MRIAPAKGVAREDFTRVLPGGFDIVFVGIAKDGFRASFAALKDGGLLCAYGYTAGVQGKRSLATIVTWIANLYFWRRLLSWAGWRQAPPRLFNQCNAGATSRLVPGGPGAAFGLLAMGAIRPRVAERISFGEIVEAHRRVVARKRDSD